MHVWGRSEEKSSDGSSGFFGVFETSGSLQESPASRPCQEAAGKEAVAGMVFAVAPKNRACLPESGPATVGGR